MSEKNNAVFVICEYNPFHYGHKHQLELLKRRYDTVICIMSGDAVQRGEAAVYQKRARAEAALRCGADAVFELPFPFSCMAAGDFARCGVLVAHSLGCSVLAFSAEGDADGIAAAASALPDRREVMEYVKNHRELSYPKAVEALVRERTGDGFALDLSAPNNILGVEYIRAATALGASMKFEIVKRDNRFESSSQIRAAGDMTSRIPREAAEVLERFAVRDMRRLDGALLAASIRLCADSDVYGMTSGDVMRLKNAAMTSRNVGEVVCKTVSKTVTAARVRRAMLCALLGITRSAAAERPLFVRLLGLNGRGAEYIAKNREKFLLPVVSKGAHIAALGAEAERQNLKTLEAEAVFALAAEHDEPKSGGVIYIS